MSHPEARKNSIPQRPRVASSGQKCGTSDQKSEQVGGRSIGESQSRLPPFCPVFRGERVRFLSGAPREPACPSSMAVFLLWTQAARAAGTRASTTSERA